MNRLISNQRTWWFCMFTAHLIVIGPVVLSSKAHLCVSGFVIVTETCFCSHGPISRVTTHLRDSSEVPFSCASSVTGFLDIRAFFIFSNLIKKTDSLCSCCLYLSCFVQAKEQPDSISFFSWFVCLSLLFWFKNDCSLFWFGQYQFGVYKVISI